jgi:hypothetical protein
LLDAFNEPASSTSDPLSVFVASSFVKSAP